MFRGFRHKLLLLLQTGILLSAAIALAIQPAAWQALLIATLGAVLAALLCGRMARRYLNASIGKLRRVADDVGHGRPADTLEAHPGDDMYKLISAINLLATRLQEASREEKRLHEELRRRERLAFLGELAASVAHEVNNPLDGIQNCARILRRSSNNPERAAQMLDLIDGGLERIELIVRRLLTLAREHVIRPTETRLSDVIAGALEVVRPKIENRQIELVQRVTADDDRCLADKALLEQVFVNLIINAADSMNAAGQLQVNVRREAAEPTTDDAAQPDEHLCVDVIDSGSGIAADVMPHIFEPFFTTKPGGKGTGLGLAIAARIVDAHDGSIRVEPRPEGGTVFTVRLPASQKAAGPSPRTAAAASSTS